MFLQASSGPDHDKHFTVEVHLNSNVIGKGGGRSKKEAEQQAAREALELMGTEFMKHANVALFVPHNGCPHQCSFCNQNRITGEDHQPQPEEVAALLQSAAKQMGERVQNAEIAFFGGSFTAIDPDCRLALLKTAHAACET